MKMAEIVVGDSIIALMMEAEKNSETSVNVFKTILSTNPEDSHLHEEVTSTKEYIYVISVLYFVWVSNSIFQPRRKKLFLKIFENRVLKRAFSPKKR